MKKHAANRSAVYADAAARRAANAYAAVRDARATADAARAVMEQTRSAAWDAEEAWVKAVRVRGQAIAAAKAASN
jgi:hypothetical protein